VLSRAGGRRSDRLLLDGRGALDPAEAPRRRAQGRRTHLHFRAEARYARVAAELYLERGGQQDGLQALAKLQLCFQADPKNIDVLDLLSRAFVAIGQAPKALEVKKEIARLAQEQGRDDVFQEVMTFLELVAPDDEQVASLRRGGLLSQRPSANSQRPETSYDDDVELLESSVHPQRGASVRPEPSIIPDTDDFDFDENPVSRGALSRAHRADGEREALPPPRPFMASAPDVVVVDEDMEAAEEILDADSTDAHAHARKAVIDAESFRGLRLYSKAIETLHIALEIDPQSIEIREKLRDVLIEAGDNDGAIGEMISLAAIHMDRGQTHLAEAELYQVLEAEPGHAAASEMLEQLGGFDGEVSPYTDEHYDSTTTEVAEPELTGEAYDPEAPLPSYDLEEIPASAAMHEPPHYGGFEADDPFENATRVASAPSYPRVEDLDDYLEEPAPAPPLSVRARGQSMIPGGVEGIEEALEEAEFFTLRGLVDDARAILSDALARAPGHPLLVERLRELDGNADSAESGTHERTDPEQAAGDDRVFDIAASLDALDELEQSTRSSRPPTSLPPRGRNRRRPGLREIQGRRASADFGLRQLHALRPRRRVQGNGPSS